MALSMKDKARRYWQKQVEINERIIDRKTTKFDALIAKHIKAVEFAREQLAALDLN